MRCERTHPLAMLCDDCRKKWIVQPDTLDGWMEFFCFDTEAEARACYEHIEKHNEYDGTQFKPKTAVLLAPIVGTRPGDDGEEFCDAPERFVKLADDLNAARAWEEGKT